MVEQYIRWDFIGLSTDDKPTSENEKVTDGSTYYESDTSKYYVYYKGTWYEKQDTGGGGTTIELYKTVGQNEDGAMTQKATTDMIFGDGGTGYKIKIGSDTTDSGDDGIAIGHSATISGADGIVIGHSATASGSDSICLGHSASVTGQYGIAMGNEATNAAYGSVVLGKRSGVSNAAFDSVVIGDASNLYGKDSVGIGGNISSVGERSVSIGMNTAVTHAKSVALGAWARSTVECEVNVGTGLQKTYGYNGTPYRIINGVHDGINNHCAATVAQGNTLATSAPTTATEGVLGQLYTDTTNMHTYQCTAIDTTDPANPSYTWTQRW